MRTPFSSRLSLLCAALPLFAVVGCADIESTLPPPTQVWSEAALHLEVALLSVSGTAPNDVWAVGAEAGKGGVILHYDGTAWSRVESNTAYDLWWVHAVAPDDVWISGAGATLLHWDGSGLTRFTTPGRAADTVFGVWASGPKDVWAAGGRAGRYGFLWHFDGIDWKNVPLPDDVPLDGMGELPGLFKVWGKSPTDVYAVGGHGLMLHFGGAGWSVVPTETTETLFTVSGDEDEVVVVGGGTSGVVLDGTWKFVGPEGAPLLQGVSKAPDNSTWVSGEKGTIYKQLPGEGWEQISPGFETEPQSLHAIWSDSSGEIWTVGGNVLSAALDEGVLWHRGPKEIATAERVDPDPPKPAVCPEDRVDIVPAGSIARRWNELLLDSIRRDIPKPGLHARNLFHTSVAMFDAWAAYDSVADGVVFQEKLTADDVESARTTAISYAAYRVLTHRYQKAAGGGISLACYDAFMSVLGYDPSDTHDMGDDPVALGNRVGAAVIAAYADDGANEANDYADTTAYAPVNPPLIVDRPGTVLNDPDRWQELNLAQAETQNGIILDSGVQKYIGPNWGYVMPFALPPDMDGTGVHHDVDLVPTVAMPQMKDWVVQMIETAGALDPNDPTTIDISPGAFGNNPLGTNDGTGYPVNPATDKPYSPNVVPLGDFARVLAEFWADGPKSETPPGHWNVLANYVSDAPTTEYKPWGMGDPVGRLEWDVKLYLTLNAAVHDAAITAWGIKRAYTTARPISLVRYMAGKGQSSDPSAPSYSEEGIPLVPGLIELITDESAAEGQRHYHLRYWKGQVAVKSWLGEPGDRANETGHVGWMRGIDWIPYQRRTFVTPAFPGLISGHSTFSRAAAEVLSAYTASIYFPGGLGEFVAEPGKYLVFEDGPSVEVRLQWATYYDAADQAGQSRIWGGIHIWPDDYQGRELGSIVGMDAASKAKTHFEGTAVP
ncbi:MAG: vanadium-dependent haloperoxidase [Polyangiaceae bacterium]|nr:vanadium-dependent haloperoxidase [Polyangiaceae bacterium]